MRLIPSSGWSRGAIMVAVLVVSATVSATGTRHEGTALEALRAGFAALDAGDFAAAVRNYQSALDLSSGDEQRFQALVGFATSLDGLGQRGAACDRFAEAVALQPQNGEVRRSRAAACAAAGRLDEAIGELEWLVAQEPDDIAAHRELIVLYAASGHHAKSADAARAVLAMAPNDGPAGLALGVALYHLERFRDAVAVLDKVVAAAPDFHQARFALGMALLYADDRPRSLEQYALLKGSAPELAAELYRNLFP